MVEWFRVDPWPRIRAILLTGPPLLTTGALVIAVSFLARASDGVRLEAAIVGFVLVAGSATYTMLAMQRVLRDEAFLALRTDGVSLQCGSAETFVAWDDLESVLWNRATGALVLKREGGSEVTVSRPFSGIEGSELATRIATAKRKAAMNLLR
jgi:hypothetical protein